MSRALTIVVKIGTSSLTRPESGQLALSTIASLVETLCQIRQMGHHVVLVSSGAVGVGCRRLNMAERPKNHFFETGRRCRGSGAAHASI